VKKNKSNILLMGVDEICFLKVLNKNIQNVRGKSYVQE